MLVTCNACSSRYNVPDEKVRGRKAKITCKKCGAAILVDGSGLGPAEPTQASNGTRTSRAQVSDGSNDSASYDVREPSGRRHSFPLEEVARRHVLGAFEDGTLVRAPGSTAWIPPGEISGVKERDSALSAPRFPRPPDPDDTESELSTARQKLPSFSDQTVSLGATEGAALTRQAFASTSEERVLTRLSSELTPVSSPSAAKVPPGPVDETEDEIEAALSLFDVPKPAPSVAKPAPNPAPPAPTAAPRTLSQLGGKPQAAPLTISSSSQTAALVEQVAAGTAPLAERSNMSLGVGAGPAAQARPGALATMDTMAPPANPADPAPNPPASSRPPVDPTKDSKPPSLRLPSPPPPPSSGRLPSVPPSGELIPSGVAQSLPNPFGGASAPSSPLPPPSSTWSRSEPPRFPANSKLPQLPGFAAPPNLPTPPNPPSPLAVSSPLTGEPSIASADAARQATSPPGSLRPTKKRRWFLVTLVLLVLAGVALRFLAPPLWERLTAPLRPHLHALGARLGLTAPLPEAAQGPSFDAQAASVILEDAASRATRCTEPGAPTGQGRVKILFATNGEAEKVLLSPPFDTGSSRSCLTQAFQGARVPPFGGEPVVVSKSFTIR